MNNQLPIKVGNKIKHYRNLKNISLLKLSELSGIDYSYLCKIENGSVNSTIQKLNQIASALNIELNQLFIFETDIINIDFKEEINRLINNSNYNNEQYYNLFQIISNFNQAINNRG